MSQPIIGVIGGTGLGQALAAQGAGEQIEMDTPFGRPSSPITLTRWHDQALALMSRHGDGHVYNPSTVPYRANVFALKKIGVTHIIASGATGSLREQIKPRDLVIPDQIIDRTDGRPRTFFERDIAVHVEFARPFCEALRRALLEHRAEVPSTVHDGGVYVCMEGPQFSTVAESNLYRSWNGDLVGMTCMPEARLARESEMCYALVALPTDYDCWRAHDPHHDQATLLEEILENLQAATEHAIRLIKAAVGGLAGSLDTRCTCHSALDRAIWSDKSKLDRAELAPLKPLLEKYITFDA